MKKTTVILFITLFLLETSGLKEIIKTPLLIHHYFEHIASHPKDDFISFITKHYITEQRSDSAHDKKTDTQLPFKSLESFQAHISAFIISEAKISAVIFNTESPTFTVCGASAIFSRSFDIWQPPKLDC